MERGLTKSRKKKQTLNIQKIIIEKRTLIVNSLLKIEYSWQGIRKRKSKMRKKFIYLYCKRVKKKKTQP